MPVFSAHADAVIDLRQIEDDAPTEESETKTRKYPRQPVVEEPSELELAQKLFDSSYVMTFGHTPPQTTEIAVQIVREPRAGLTMQRSAEASKQSVVLFYNQREAQYLLRWMKLWMITSAMTPLVVSLIWVITATLVKRIVLGSWEMPYFSMTVALILICSAVAFSMGLVVQRLVWSGWRHSLRLLWEECSRFLSNRLSNGEGRLPGGTATRRGAL